MYKNTRYYLTYPNTDAKLWGIGKEVYTDRLTLSV